MSKLLIWYPLRAKVRVDLQWFEIWASEKLGMPMFTDATWTHDRAAPVWDKEDPRKKIAIIQVESLKTQFSQHADNFLIGPIDLSAWDLVILFSTEALECWWSDIYNEFAEQLNTTKLVWVFGGGQSYSSPPPENTYLRYLTFFNRTVLANEYQDCSATSKPYLFDALIGTLKPTRLFVLYQILDSKFKDKILTNIQPHPMEFETVGIEAWRPEQFERMGVISDYQSPGLLELEQPEIKEFKIATKDADVNQRYSTNVVPNPVTNKIGMSCVMPWNIYRNSWYSIVCETYTAGYTYRFITEKTAKCLYGKRIFIMFASAGTLDYIKSFGFRTFHGKYIDERYDKTFSDYERAEKAWAAVERLAEFDPLEVTAYYQEVLDHNHELMKKLPQEQISKLNEFIHSHIDLIPGDEITDEIWNKVEQLPEIIDADDPEALIDGKDKYFVWTPHRWWDMWYAQNCHAVDFFHGAEIFEDGNLDLTGLLEKKLHGDPRKKIVILDYQVLINIEKLNLAWADIIIVFSTEPLTDWWTIIYGDLTKKLNHDQIICAFNGEVNYTQAPRDIFITRMTTWLSKVVWANEYQNIDANNTPFRKYMFDALMGTTKTSRLYLLYRLLESDFADQVVTSFQPSQHGYDWSEIERVDPIGYRRWGQISDHITPALVDIDHPVYLGLQSRANTAAERYSGNIVTINSSSGPKHIQASVPIPWQVYQSSWYSIICETADKGASVRFLTEKTGKCLFAKRIFVMFAGAGLLKYLKSFGFRTFHGDIIDESYDDEPDDAKRYAMAWEQICRLQKTEPRHIYPLFEEVLEHNYHTMMYLGKQQSHTINKYVESVLRRYSLR
jgi:hypothetical protein